MTPKPHHKPAKAIGYVRVSTGKQVESGLGLEAQRTAIQTEAAARGWELELIEDQGVSGKSLQRPGITRALDLLDRGEYDVLLVSKLDRIARSVIDGANLMRRAEDAGWSVVALDMNIDMTTPAGKFMVNSIFNMAEFERALISQRTTSALKAKVDRGEKLPGGKTQLPDSTIRLILSARAAGQSMAGIARQLEADAVPTARAGTHWHASTVAAVIRSRRAAELRD